MGCCKKVLITSFSVIGLLLSVINIWKAARLLVRRGAAECTYASPGRDLLLGFFTFAFSVVGILSACATGRTKKLLQRVYSWLLVVLAIALIGTAAFLIAVAAQHSSSPVKYPQWLRERLVDGKAWASFKTCLGQEQVCKGLANANDNDFKDSCCGPSDSQCGNGTSMNGGDSSRGHDCSAWSSKSDKICYDCDACKAKYLEKFCINVTVFVGYLFAVLVVFLIGRCGFEKERQANNVLPYGQLPQVTVAPVRPPF